MKDAHRPVVKYLTDLIGWSLMTPVAFWIRMEDPWLPFAKEILILMAVGVPAKAVVIYLLGFHVRSWHRVGVRDLSVLLQGIVAVSLLLSAAAFFLPSYLSVPRGVPLIEGMMAVLGLGAGRLVVRLWSESQRRPGKRAKEPGTRRMPARRVFVAGAGEAGTMMAREMMRHPESGLIPVGFLDDDPGKRRQRFLGLPVLGTVDELATLAPVHRVEEVIIAMPSEDGATVRRVVNLARTAGVKHRIIPGIYDLLSGKVAISQIREVDLEDLLRRERVSLDVCDIEAYVRGQTVLVTGAGGSIGSEIVRQVMRFEPSQVLLLGRGENSIYEIEQECRHAWPHVACRSIIADVRDREKLAHTFREHRPQVVFHAAAHKHVPLMEANPDEAVLNNVCGTRNLSELSLEYGVRRFVNISTDKAVNPTSIMGASKRAAEYMVERASRQAPPGHCFVSVRFGNVLGSRGSVIPLFKRQIKRGGPITVTHPDMKRYFMTIPEAVQLVLQAGGLGENGRVYVLDMGEPVRIVDMARDLIHLSGLEPDVDIPIVFAGIRPGEKLYEELLTAEEGTIASRHEKIFVARKNGLPNGRLALLLEELIEAAVLRDGDAIREVFKEMIPSFSGILAEPAASSDGGPGTGTSSSREPVVG